jgi:hypothetical protein
MTQCSGPDVSWGSFAVRQRVRCTDWRQGQAGAGDQIDTAELLQLQEFFDDVTNV